MDEDRQGQSIYLQWTNIQTRAINIPAMDDQTDKGNRYTYDELTDRQGQSIYLQWTNRQKRAINIPTMDEQTNKSNQYTYD
jgi:hypothetical protein